MNLFQRNKVEAELEPMASEEGGVNRGIVMHRGGGWVHPQTSC